MKSVTMCLLALCSMSMVGACADEGGGPAGPEVAIEVAPLTLPGVLGVEYALAVFNASPAVAPIFTQSGTVANNIPNLVWQQGSVTSNQFGNGPSGDISYIGPCDASVPAVPEVIADPGANPPVLGVPAIPAGANFVAIALKQVDAGPNGGSYNGFGPFTDGPLNVLDDQLTAQGGAGGVLSADSDPDFVNPCTYLTPCMLSFVCVENADVEIVFNLAIMRDANQGFFDIAVNFEDIFCSSKYDSCYADGTPITLLHGDDVAPEGPGRDTTGVFAMACTAGPGSTVDTEILMSLVTVTCPDVTFLLPVAGAPGNRNVPVDFDGVGLGDDPRNVQYATYYGKEELSCGAAGSCNKAYLNIAINLEDLPLGCTLGLQASAQDTAASVFTFGSLNANPGTGTLHPFINVVAANLSQTACIQDAFNDGGSVSTFYGSTMLGGTPAQVMCVKSTEGGEPVLTGASLCTL